MSGNKLLLAFSVLAVLLAVKRLGRAEGRDLVFAGAPASLASLAALYGVEEMLGRG